jgi:hypothetical protein
MTLDVVHIPHGKPDVIRPEGPNRFLKAHLRSKGIPNGALMSRFHQGSAEICQAQRIDRIGLVVPV